MGILGKRTGSIAFDGKETIGMQSDHIARLGIAYCPEERGIFSSLNVDENLRLPPVVKPGGLSIEEIYKLFPNLLERRHSQGTKLSGGEQQMLAIGRILRTGATLLLLDEPTEGLAPVIVQHRRDHPPAQEPRLHHPAGRAELPFRRYRRGPSLCDGRRPCGRHGHLGRCAADHRQAASVSGGLKMLSGEMIDLLQKIASQATLGLINGAFYAMLSLGLAVIFGMLNVINFTHGAQYMMGAFAAWLMLTQLDIPFWAALVLAPLVVGLFGIVLEKVMLKRIYHLDHLYGFLLTFGLALIIEGSFQWKWGSSGAPYPNPIPGGTNLGYMFMPTYRGFVVVAALVICLATWYGIERTKLGAYLRAATENPTLVRAFGINVPRLITLTYGLGVGLAALAGVLAAPIQQVSALMGTNLVLVVFAVVVIGGMGSIMGSIVTGFGLGMLEGLTKVVYPPASNTVIFVVMALVLLIKPAGLFGQTK
jgi:branched-chain amino acid transport system permease protein